MTDRLSPYGVQELLKTLQRYRLQPEMAGGYSYVITPPDDDGEWVFYPHVEALLRTLLIPQDDYAPCYCCRGDEPAQDGHPAFCQPGCKCYEPRHTPPKESA